MEHRGGDYPQGLLTSGFPPNSPIGFTYLTEFSLHRKASRFQSRIHCKVLDAGVVDARVLERARQKSWQAPNNSVKN